MFLDTRLKYRVVGFEAALVGFEAVNVIERASYRLRQTIEIGTYHDTGISSNTGHAHLVSGAPPVESSSAP